MPEPTPTSSALPKLPKPKSFTESNGMKLMPNALPNFPRKAGHNEPSKQTPTPTETPCMSPEELQRKIQALKNHPIVGGKK